MTNGGRCRLRHEHACGGGHRQQRTEADEDLPDQGGLVPGRAFIAAGGNGCGRRGGCFGRGQRQGWRVRRRRALAQRAIDVVELIGGNDLASAAGQPACPARPAEYRWPGRTSPWRHCRSAYRRTSVVHWRWPPMAGSRMNGRAPSAAAAFLSAEDFSATLLDLRCAYFFQWREPCLAYLWSATGAAAVSDFALAAESSAAGRLRWPRETHKKPCC